MAAWIAAASPATAAADETSAAEETSTAEPAAPDNAPVPPAYSDFLDSLRARASAGIERRGVREAWPTADSLESLVREHGPSYADTARIDAPPRALDLAFDPDVRFNRVEGLLLGGGLRFGRAGFALQASGAWGTASETWRHRTRLQLPAPRGRLAIEVAERVVPFGQHPVPGNDVYGLIAGADDQDYLARRGVEVSWSTGIPRGRFEIAYEVADASSVTAATDWNLIGRDRGPRPNPAIDAGRARRLRVGAERRWKVPELRSALIRLRGEVDVTGYGLGGDFDYDRYALWMQTDLHGPGRDDLRLTVRAGAARNGPPVQSRFYLGGPLLLRAYPVNALAGDRLLAGALEYHLGWDLLARLGLPQAQIQFVPFFETGATWFDANGTGLFSSPESSDWRSDAGLALRRSFLFGIAAQLDLAFRLDRSDDRLTTRLRVSMPLFDRAD